MDFQTLPGECDNEVMDLDPTCSMVRHLEAGLDFLRSLMSTSRGQSHSADVDDTKLNPGYPTGKGADMTSLLFWEKGGRPKSDDD